MLNWLLLNLLPITLVGATLLLFSFLKIRPRKPIWFSAIIGALLLVLVAALMFRQVFSNPGGESTEVVTVDDQEKTKLDDSHIARLRASWDSEKRTPNWPVCETLALISKAAYLSPFDAQSKYRELDFNFCVPVVQGSMIGYVIANDDVR